MAKPCFYDGISDFDALRSRRHDDEVQLYAFDILTMDGDDLRKLPLHLRKNSLARLLERRPQGIFVSEFERRGNRAGPFRGGLRIRA